MPKDNAVEDEKLWPGQPVKGKKTTVELSPACFLVCGVFGLFWFGFLFGNKIKADFWRILGVLTDVYQRVSSS